MGISIKVVVAACSFGAIDEDEKRFPLFNESRCRRCGTCMGACPVRVISFENYSVNTVGAQIKAVDIPDEFSEKPRARKTGGKLMLNPMTAAGASTVGAFPHLQ